MTTILLVDDNPIDRRLISGLLSCVDTWNIRLAEDGQHALDDIEDVVPDIVVTDLQMPRVNGLELVAHLKKSHPQIPVLLITSQGSEDIAIEALRAGAVNYSPKKAMSRDLVRTIQKVISVASKVSSNAVVTLAPVDEFEVQYEIQNDVELIWPLIEQLQSSLPHWTVPDHMQIGMALDEAITNAIYHGNLEVESKLKDAEEDAFFQLVRQRNSEAPFCERVVKIEAAFAPDEFQISITDQGPGFVPQEVPDCRDEENLTKLSGRGLFLIRSFMDEVTHNESGNRITLVKRNKATSESS